jgi:cell filamentation protein
LSFVDPYLIPGTHCLRNKLGIDDPKLLDHVERLYTTQRAAEGIPTGQFDLPHLQAIHHQLFQDVYDWAGQTRTVEIAKGGNHFLMVSRIEMGMNDVHARLKGKLYLEGLSRADFATAAGQVIGDLNYVHPFREGNGRTQMLYLDQLAREAGHPLDLRRIKPEDWIAASKAAHDGDYSQMGAQIAKAAQRRSRGH